MLAWPFRLHYQRYFGGDVLSWLRYFFQASRAIRCGIFNSRMPARLGMKTAPGAMLDFDNAARPLIISGAFAPVTA